MTAAVAAAENGADTAVIEKNAALGRKLAITGKGRCNVTNNCSVNTVLENIPNNARFLYGALSRFSPQDVIRFFEDLGVPLKTERGNRVFPVSDKAADIVNALSGRLDALGVKIIHENARSLILEDGLCVGVNTHNRQHRANSVILAAGGASYPRTGSDGSGYRLAEQAGHTIIPPRPSLCPMTVKEKWVSQAAGLTLRNTAIRLLHNNKTIYEDFGEIAFTADGIGGATALSASAHIPANGPLDTEDISIVIDLKPALSHQQLDARLLRDYGELHGKTFSDSLRKLLPAELCAPFAGLSGIPADKKVDEITRSERRQLVGLLKGLTLTISGFRPIDEAIVTRGGIKISEISPKTMESKLCAGLFFAGEIIDVDGYTGGFNLQIAFATGRLAGLSASDR